MIERSEILLALPPYQNNKRVLVNSQQTEDIISQLLKTHKIYGSDYDRISKNFWKGNIEQTARYLFDFLKKNVRYSIEPDFHQSVKSPSAIIATGIYKDGLNDCKHYSQFISGVLDSLKRFGYPVDWFYRFANYNMFTTSPGHVFVVAKNPKTGREFWVDPVLSSFDNRKSFINAIDKKISGMPPLYSISGIDDLSGIGATTATTEITGIGKAKKKKGRLFMKVHLAPSRGAYLLMVRVNLFGMAKRLYSVMQKNEPKLKKLWEKIGGKYSVLKKTVMKAMKKKGVHGIEHPYSISGTGCIQGSIGVAPLAAALAAAVPVITAMATLVGKIKGGGKEDIIDAAKDAAGEIATAAQGGKVSLPDFGAEHEKIDKAEGTVDPPETGAGGTDNKAGGAKSSMMMPLLIGGGLLAAVLVLKPSRN